jgi:hypothetical protein
MCLVAKSAPQHIAKNTNVAFLFPAWQSVSGLADYLFMSPFVDLGKYDNSRPSAASPDLGQAE